MTEPEQPGTAPTGVDELLARFTSPGPEYGPVPIWWWSGAPLTRERLRWQLERMVAGGIRAAVVLCLAPTGPMFGSVADDPPFLSPAWLTLFDQVCADAAKLGCALWMYDQIGFSGANLQGELIAAEPSFAGQALFRTVGAGSGIDTVVTLRPPEGHRPLAGYAVLDSGARVEVPVADGGVRWVGEPARVTLVHAGASGFDYFSEAACAALLDQVHGTLERAVGHWFGTAIGGFFQDELPPMPTWGPDFAATFAARHGYDLLPRLWALWEPDGGAEAARVRRDYHEHRAALARRGFFDQHDAWFEARGLTCGFDQASPAREGDPVGGVQTYGDYLGLHAGYGAPGSDHWGDAKVHSSLAHARGHDRVWLEAFHSSGWGGTLEETYDWLAPFLRRGARLYDPHAVYYATVGGWWEWAPPSTCWRQPYWPSYDVFATAVARLCAVLTAGRHVCDVLLLSPTSTAQAHLTLDGPLPDAKRAGRVFGELSGVNTWFAERRGVLERAGIDHDALDEVTVAGGEVVGSSAGEAGLRIGDETYRTVLLPAATVLAAGAARRLLELAAAVVARRRHERDPRFVCRWVRPHPLPGAGWLDPAAAPGDVVLPLVPDIAPGPTRTEWLRLVLPLGTVSFRVRTQLDVVAVLAGEELKVDGGLVRLPAPAPAGTTALLRLTGIDGRRGGALLDGPVEVDVTTAEVPLVAWEQLGLRALGGRVTYRTAVHHEQPEPGTRTVLDLGELRGTADVLINGTLAARLVWGPWRTEVTGLLRPGENELAVVVGGTLAGYLDDASPTSGVYAGQVRTGLLGPVTLRAHRAP